MMKRVSWLVTGIAVAGLGQVCCAGQAAPQEKPQAPPPAKAAPAPSSPWKDMALPADAKILRVKSGAEENAYAVVTSPSPLSLKVQGPCRLRVKVRLQIRKGTKPPIAYSVLTSLDGQEARKRVFKGSPSMKASFVGAAGDLVPSGSENIDMDIPAGEHLVKVSLPEKDPQTLCVRHLTEPPRAAPAPPKAPAQAAAPSSPWKDMPLPADAKTVRIKSGAEENVYALVTSSSPLGLKVEGPCRLRVKVRLQIRKGAKPPFAYAVLTALDGQPARRRAFRGSPSMKASLVGAGADLVPSGSENIDMDIPAGEHLVKVSLPEKDPQTLCVRHLTEPPRAAPATPPASPPKK